MKREAPAAARNREPIAAILAEELPATGLVLEIASGTGEHAVHFARTFPQLEWQPSDPDVEALASIGAWRADERLPNLRNPLDLDVCELPWPVATADAVVCINMVHISPVRSTHCLFTGAESLLATGAPLILYGPYIEAGVETAPSNLEFDAWLRGRNLEWGLREVEWLDGLAESRGFSRTRRVAMPANNLTLVYRRRSM